MQELKSFRLRFTHTLVEEVKKKVQSSIKRRKKKTSIQTNHNKLKHNYINPNQQHNFKPLDKQIFNKNLIRRKKRQKSSEQFVKSTFKIHEIRIS